MKDQEMVQDLMSCEQALAASYLNTVLNSSSPLLQDTISQLLNITLQNVQLIGQEMQSYNWINPMFGSKIDLDQLQFRYQSKGKQLENALKLAKLGLSQ